VLHVGAGLGYYTAVMAATAGPTGRVLGIEVDNALAAAAGANVASMPWIELRHDDATAPLDEAFDAILVNAGVTHVRATWLDALVPGGRLVVPLTVPMPQMGATIGKGITVLITKTLEDRLDARMLGYVAIYSGLGLRDDALNARLGEALRRTPLPSFTCLRRDEHEPRPSCWLHGPDSCLSVS